MNALLIRGSRDWDQREYRRRAVGNCCISFGSIPPQQARGEPEYREVTDAWRSTHTPQQGIFGAEKLTIEQKVNYFARLEA